jgi:hypothetical protein
MPNIKTKKESLRIKIIETEQQLQHEQQNKKLVVIELLNDNTLR